MARPIGPGLLGEFSNVPERRVALSTSSLVTGTASIRVHGLLQIALSHTTSKTIQ
jgi:hypothetical protein